MSKVDSIVVAFDFSADATRAVRRAAMVAAEHKAALRLLHVVNASPLEPLRSWFGSPARADAAFTQTRAAVEELASKTAEEWRIDVTPLVRRGNAVEEVLRASDEADMVVVGDRGADPLQDFVRGTMAARLMSKCRRPLLIVKLPAERPYQRILVPIDFSDRSPAALRLASQLAPRAGIHVVHAYKSLHEGMLRNANIPEREIERLRTNARADALADMRAVLDPLREQGTRWRTTVKRGDEVALTLETQRRIAADLVVLSPRRRSAAAQMLLGSMSREFLLRDPPSDVLVMPEPVSAKQSGPSGAREHRALAG